MAGFLGKPGTAGSVRFAGSIAGAGPPPAGTGWDPLDVVIDGNKAQWLHDSPGTWSQITGTAPVSVFQQATASILPSATGDTFGTAATLTPGTGFNGLFPTSISYLTSGLATETVTVQIVVTWNDATTTTTTTTATTDSTTNFSASQIAAVLAGGDGKHATSVTVSVKSSIDTSGASAVLTLAGINHL